MKFHHLIFKVSWAAIFFLLLNTASRAQSITGVEAIAPEIDNSQWVINVSFVPVPAQEKIKQAFLIDIEDAKIIMLSPLQPSKEEPKIYTATPGEPLKTAPSKTGGIELAKHYELKATVENDKGDKVLSLGAAVELLDLNKVEKQEVKAKAKDAEDADVYISGELNGAHKRQASFTTEIKLQKYNPISARWRYTPFFKLNASTDPDADPDKMEAGMRLRYVTGGFAGIPGAYFDNDFKLESERDFDNTNLIYDTRLTFLPAAFPKGFKVKGKDSKIRVNNYKVFFNPFIGGEFGKNLHSPLQTAEGDGIARLLVGADLRLAFFLKNEDEPDVNWTTSYTRRWLLTDELGFKADKDGDLQLNRFGKSPRDYILSKLSYKIAKFFDVFVAYEWGQVPPSFKLVDHRFRLGFAYKYKFAVK